MVVSAKFVSDLLRHFVGCLGGALGIKRQKSVKHVPSSKTFVKHVFLIWNMVDFCHMYNNIQIFLRVTRTSA